MVTVTTTDTLAALLGGLTVKHFVDRQLLSTGRSAYLRWGTVNCGQLLSHESPENLVCRDPRHSQHMRVAGEHPQDGGIHKVMETAFVMGVVDVVDLHAALGIKPL